MPWGGFEGPRNRIFPGGPAAALRTDPEEMGMLVGRPWQWPHGRWWWPGPNGDGEEGSVPGQAVELESAGFTGEMAVETHRVKAM